MMMTAEDIVETVAVRGGIVAVVESPEGMRLRVTPASILTPDLTDALRRGVPQVIAFLQKTLPQEPKHLGFLDYADEQLGSHPDWGDLSLPSCWERLPPYRLKRGTAYYTLNGKQHPYEYDLDASLSTPTPADQLRATPSKSITTSMKTEEKNKHINICGGCGLKVHAKTEAMSANLLQEHIEYDPCEHYRTSSKIEKHRD